MNEEKYIAQLTMNEEKYKASCERNEIQRLQNFIDE